MNGTFLLSLALILNLARTHANAGTEACATRDLRPRLGAVDTQDLNTCYSHAVADALSIAAGKKVSPQSVLFRYLQGRGTGEGFVMNLGHVFTEKFQGGLGATALRAAQQRPVCTADEIGGAPLRERDWLNALRLHDQYRATYAPRPPTKLIGQLCDSFQKIFTNAEVEQLRRLLKTSLTFDAYAGAVMDERCHDLKDSFAKYEVRGNDFRPNAARALVGIDDALDHDQLPVVHLDPGLFFGDNPIPNVPWLPGLHVVSVAARRVVEGRCVYSVRNSWGPECATYPDAIRARCDAGTFWFTADELRPYVKSTSWLKPKD